MESMEKIKKTLSLNIKKLREIGGLSQLALAERVGLSVQMIRDIEAGRRWPSAATIEAIAIGLTVAVSVLYTQDNKAPLTNEEILSAFAENLGFKITKKPSD